MFFVRPQSILSCLLLPLLLLLLLHSTVPCSSHKILLFPVGSGSHAYCLYYVGQELIRRGDEVHMLVHWSFQVPGRWNEDDPGIKEMTLHRFGNNSDSKFDIHQEAADIFFELLTDNRGMDFIIKSLRDKFNPLMRRELLDGNEELFDHLQSLNFDVAVVDSIFFMRFTALIPHRINTSMITYADLIEPWLVRMPWLPSFSTPIGMATDSTSTFYSRLMNVWLTINFWFFPIVDDPAESVLDEYRKYGDFKDLGELLSRSLLFLVTEDPVLDVVRPYTANVVQVGGLTTESFSSNSSTLPKDHIEFLESSDDPENLGTVVVTFGSMVGRYPERLARVFLGAFELLPRYKFMWRFENYLNLSVPKNVKVVSWMNQMEMLGHSSVKLFITHSGNNGQYEAVYHGVPMLAVPLMGDQLKNARRIAERGYGEEADFRTVTRDEMVNLIQQIIEDSSYKDRIMKASRIFRSRPDTPAQRAAYWIDHVLRFGGDHLRPAGNNLYFWQYLCLDVVVFIELLILISLVLFVTVTRRVLSKVRKHLSCPSAHNTNIGKAALNKKQH